MAVEKFRLCWPINLNDSYQGSGNRKFLSNENKEKFILFLHLYRDQDQAKGAPLQKIKVS